MTWATRSDALAPNREEISAEELGVWMLSPGAMAGRTLSIHISRLNSSGFGCRWQVEQYPCASLSPSKTGEASSALAQARLKETRRKRWVFNRKEGKAAETKR